MDNALQIMQIPIVEKLSYGIVVIIAGFFAIKIASKLDILYRIGWLLEWMHSATARYYGMIIVILSGEGYVAERAASVYYLFFWPVMKDGPQMAGYPVILVSSCFLVGLLVFFGGFYISTHVPEPNEQNAYNTIRVIILLHDWAGIVLNEVQGLKGKDDVTIWSFILMALALCALSTLPLMLGKWMVRLHTTKDEEEIKRHAQFATHHERETQKFAIRELSKSARKVPKEELWKFLPEDQQEYGKRLQEIISGQYQGAIAKSKPVSSLPEPANTAPLLAAPAPVNTQHRELPITPNNKTKEEEYNDAEYEEEEIEEEDSAGKGGAVEEKQNFIQWGAEQVRGVRQFVRSL